MMKTLIRSNETQLCPDCPLISLLPIIMANRVTYTRDKEQLTPHKICQLLRAFWSKQPHVTLEGCRYFSKTERIDIYAKDSAETR